MGADTKTVPFVVQTAPRHIYLQVSDDSYSATEAFPDEALDQITWCAESVVETEVKYIRADLVEGLIEVAARFDAAIKEMSHV